MVKVNKIFENTYLNIINAPSSIFSREDVIKLFNEMQASLVEYIPDEPKITEATELMFQDLNSNVKSRLYQFFDQNNLVDYDSAEFEIDYNNQLILSNVNVDFDSWTDEFDDIMLEEFQSIFGNPIK